jgi:hypothetical protein
VHCGESQDADVTRRAMLYGAVSPQSMRLPSADGRDEDAANCGSEKSAWDGGRHEARRVIELDGEEPRRAGVVRPMQHCAVKRPLHTKHNIELGYVLQSLYHSTSQWAHTPYSSSLKEVRSKCN